MSYRIDLNSPATLTPCSLVPSTHAPGKTLCVNEDGSSLVVLPDGSQRVPPGEPASSGNWDSPWTQADLIDGFLVYRSSGGVPRGYRIIG